MNRMYTCLLAALLVAFCLTPASAQNKAPKTRQEGYLAQ